MYCCCEEVVRVLSVVSNNLPINPSNQANKGFSIGFLVHFVFLVVRVRTTRWLVVVVNCTRSRVPCCFSIIFLLFTWRMIGCSLQRTIVPVGDQTVEHLKTNEDAEKPEDDVVPKHQLRNSPQTCKVFFVGRQEILKSRIEPTSIALSRSIFERFEELRCATR